MANVALRSLCISRLVMKGPATGTRYVWSHVGEVRYDINAADAPGLLSNVVRRTLCCDGRVVTSKYVEEVLT